MQLAEIATNSTTSEQSRRRRRAHTAPMAVGYQLLHLTEQLGLEAIVVADDVGHVLAYAGNRHMASLLADSVMWRAFSTQAIDDLTLARIRQHYPYVDLEHVACESVGTAGVCIVAVSPSWACRAAVERARVGIERICASTDGTGPAFLDPAACVSPPVQQPSAPREHGVRWAIGSMY